jgi:hypothetical protein
MKTYKALQETYRIVDTLPDNAMKVADYCRERGCTNPYIYHLWKAGKANFEIVLYKGINFIIPQ